jgi:hypothetical protein
MFQGALDGSGWVVIVVATGEFQHLQGDLTWEKGEVRPYGVGDSGDKVGDKRGGIGSGVGEAIWQWDSSGSGRRMVSTQKRRDPLAGFFPNQRVRQSFTPHTDSGHGRPHGWMNTQGGGGWNQRFATGCFGIGVRGVGGGGVLVTKLIRARDTTASGIVNNTGLGLPERSAEK